MRGSIIRRLCVVAGPCTVVVVVPMVDQLRTVFHAYLLTLAIHMVGDDHRPSQEMVTATAHPYQVFVLLTEGGIRRHGCGNHRKSARLGIEREGGGRYRRSAFD